jgi:acyl carrier protein
VQTDTTSLEARLAELLEPHLPPSAADAELGPDTPLRTLGVDSRIVVDFLVDVEDTYEIVLPDHLLTAETFESLATVAAAIGPLVAPA